MVNHDDALPALSVTCNLHHEYVLFPKVNAVALLPEIALLNEPFQHIHEYVMIHASSPVKVNVAIVFDTLTVPPERFGAMVCRVKLIVPVFVLFALSLTTT